MIIRAVTCSDLVSRLIRAREGFADPRVLKFVPSHVELAGFTLPDGSPAYLGAHDDGGVACRPVGYDKATLTGEAFFDVPLPNEDAARTYALGKIGEPYDFAAILGFLVPLADPQSNDHAICSAFVISTLIAGALFNMLAKPVWDITPLDVAFLLSARPGVTLEQTLPT